MKNAKLNELQARIRIGNKMKSLQTPRRSKTFKKGNVIGMY